MQVLDAEVRDGLLRLAVILDQYGEKRFSDEDLLSGLHRCAALLAVVCVIEKESKDAADPERKTFLMKCQGAGQILIFTQYMLNVTYSRWQDGRWVCPVNCGEDLRSAFEYAAPYVTEILDRCEAIRLKPIPSQQPHLN